jgi:hypothetical protein
MLYNTYLKGEPDSKEELGIEKCHACNMPYVVRQEVVLKVTTHRIDGLQPVEPQIKFEYEADIPLVEKITQCEPKIVADTEEFINSLPTHICSKCEREFHSENPCIHEDGVLCDDCFVSDVTSRIGGVGGTHPDPETHHCQECGLIYSHEDWCFECGTCKKCAEHLDFKELKEMVAEAKKAEPSVCEEKNEIQFTQIFGNVWAAISGESVHLKYGNSKCGIWDRTIFDTLLEMTDGERRKEIDELVEGMASKQQRKACLRQFTIALEKGEVSFPEVV